MIVYDVEAGGTTDANVWEWKHPPAGLLPADD